LAAVAAFFAYHGRASMSFNVRTYEEFSLFFWIPENSEGAFVYSAWSLLFSEVRHIVFLSLVMDLPYFPHRAIPGFSRVKEQLFFPLFFFTTNFTLPLCLLS